MVRGIAFHGSGRDFSQRHANGDPSIEQTFQHQHSYNNPASDAAIAALEGVIAALRNNGEAPIDFALMTSQGTQLRWFTSDGLRHVESRLFSEHFKNDFLGGLRRPSRPVPPGPAAPDHYHMEGRRQSYSSDSSSSRPSHRRFPRQQRDDYDSNESSSGRKRPRADSEIDDNDTPVPHQISNLKSLTIGDYDEVTQYYMQGFKNLQQTACKVIGKAFIKIIEPKKQTNHPYTGGPEKAPSWWPQLPPLNHKGPHPTGTRHKEPDHLLKDERIRLCAHILRVVMDRNPNRPVNIRAVTIRDLERVTNDAMARDFFSDKDGKLAASNPDKRPYLRQYLKEIFAVAKQEERYKDGGLDADATVNVMHGDGSLQIDDEEDEALKYENDDAEESQGIPTPESLVSSDGGHGQNSLPGSSRPIDADYSLPMHNRYIPMDEPRYQEPGMQSAHMQQQQFVPNGYQAGGIHEQENRRSAWSPNFSGTQNPYNAWASPQTNMVPTTSISFTGFSPTHAPSGSPHFNLPPPGPAPMHPMHPQYHDRLRTGSLGHPHQLPHQHSFQDYLHDSSFGQSNVDPDMKDDHHCLSQH